MLEAVGHQKNLADWKVALIEQAADILTEYKEQGYSLTLRSLHYKFVARKLYPMRWANTQGNTNTERSYKNLGEVVMDGRLAGMIDWDHVKDTTRELTATSHWETPADIMDSVAHSFRLDKWDNQPTRVEIWVEKDAQESVVARPAKKWDIGYFSCRGYVSMSAVKEAADRFQEYIDAGQNVVILYLGDHDPSGLDMPEDLKKRLSMFLADDADQLEIRRIALTKKQIAKYQPAPDPAKLSDGRAAKYMAKHGEYSWELDALEPKVLDDLLNAQIESLCDLDLFEERKADEEADRKALALARDNWPAVADFVESLGEDEPTIEERLEAHFLDYQRHSPGNIGAHVRHLQRLLDKYANGR